MCTNLQNVCSNGLLSNSNWRTPAVREELENTGYMDGWTHQVYQLVLVFAVCTLLAQTNEFLKIFHRCLLWLNKKKKKNKRKKESLYNSGESDDIKKLHICCTHTTTNKNTNKKRHIEVLIGSEETPQCCVTLFSIVPFDAFYYCSYCWFTY